MLKFGVKHQSCVGHKTICGGGGRGDMTYGYCLNTCNVHALPINELLEIYLAIRIKI